MGIFLSDPHASPIDHVNTQDRNLDYYRIMTRNVTVSARRGILRAICVPSDHKYLRILHSVNKSRCLLIVSYLSKRRLMDKHGQLEAREFLFSNVAKCRNKFN